MPKRKGRRLPGRQNAPSMANTSPQHQTIDPSTYIELRPSPLSGSGLFAHYPITSSTRIISEVPILQLREGFTSLQYLFPALNTIAKNAEKFPAIREKYEQFLDLGFTLEEEGDDEVIARVNQNAYQVEGEEGELGCLVLGLVSARINHSCEPNAVGNMNSLSNCFTVQVIRDIEPNEEITISYINLEQSAAARQESLSRYLFTCTCPACSPHTSSPQYIFETSSNRSQLSHLRHLITTYTTPFPSPGTLTLERSHLRTIFNFITLAETEGLISSLAFASHHLADTFMRLGDRETAHRWKIDERELVERTKGRDSVEGNAITDWLMERRFKGEHWYWWQQREERNDALMRGMHFWPRCGDWRVLGVH